MSKDKLNIILSCFGRADDKFVSCSGCSNTILYLSPSDPFYDEMMDYFDTLQLFDKPLFNINAIRHVIFNMQDRFAFSTHALWSEKMFHLYQKFVIDHKDCGLRLHLQLFTGE